MLDGFTLLAYAFCAAVIPAGTRELVAVGYVSLDRCFIQIETGENIAKVIEGHDVSIEVLQDGAVIGIDTLRFFVSKAPSI